MTNQERPQYAVLFEPTKSELETWPFLCIGGVTKESIHPFLAHYCDVYNAYKLNLLIAALLKQREIEQEDQLETTLTEDELEYLKAFDACPNKLPRESYVSRAGDLLTWLIRLAKDGFEIQGEKYTMADICVGGRFCGRVVN